MKPTLQQFMEGSSRWQASHLGINYELSWHGYSADFSPQGTWCWYIILTQEQFRNEDWQKLAFGYKDSNSTGSWHRLWNYDDFPDCDPHGGWTFGEMTTYLGRDGHEYSRIKVGCDYAHAFDRDCGYWQGKDAVEKDVKASIEKFIQLFPRRKTRCAYSGIYDEPEMFFETNAGWFVHLSHEDKTFDHPNWQRKEKSE